MEQLKIKGALALVFSGGGARGSFEYGVWKALRELGIVYDIQGIAGTSIGSLNTLFYIQKDFYKARDIWKSLTLEDVIRINRSSLSLLLQIIRSYPESLKNFSDVLKLLPLLQSFEGFLDNKTLRRILETNINMVKIANNQLDTFVCCTKLPSAKGETLKPIYFDIRNQSYTKEELISIFMASSAIYPFFDKIQIQGSYYIDGGFTDNTPILPLYKLGYRKFIVAYLNNQQKPFYKLDEITFPNCQFVEIRPGQQLPTDPKTTLNFSKEAIDAFMDDGYIQTMGMAEEIEELGE